MNIRNIFDLTGRALSAQMIRMNTIASNIANVNAVSNSEETAYRALKPVFRAVYSDALKSDGIATVDVEGISRKSGAVEKRYSPGHPVSDEDGYIYLSNVNLTNEMVDMLEAKHQYQNSVEVLNTVRSLMMRTLKLGS